MVAGFLADRHGAGAVSPRRRSGRDAQRAAGQRAGSAAAARGIRAVPPGERDAAKELLAAPLPGLVGELRGVAEGHAARESAVMMRAIRLGPEDAVPDDYTSVRTINEFHDG